MNLPAKDCGCLCVFFFHFFFKLLTFPIIFTLVSQFHRPIFSPCTFPLTLFEVHLRRLPLAIPYSPLRSARKAISNECRVSLFHPRFIVIPSKRGVLKFSVIIPLLFTPFSTRQGEKISSGARQSLGKFTSVLQKGRSAKVFQRFFSRGCGK